MFDFIPSPEFSKTDLSRCIICMMDNDALAHLWPFMKAIFIIMGAFLSLNVLNWELSKRSTHQIPAKKLQTYHTVQPEEIHTFFSSFVGIHYRVRYEITL